MQLRLNHCETFELPNVQQEEEKKTEDDQSAQLLSGELGNIDVNGLCAYYKGSQPAEGVQRRILKEMQDNVKRLLYVI